MTDEDTSGHTRAVAAVLGANVRRLRAERTMADLARCAQRWGLKWTTGTVANVESGRSAATIGTLYALTLALGDLLGRKVAPVELFDGTGMVSVPGGEVELGMLRTVLSTEAPRRPKPDTSHLTTWVEENWATLPEPLQDDPVGPYRKTLAAMVESDVRVGKSLGLDRALTARWMAHLWKRPLSVERDARAGAGANAQARGQISRVLKAELRKVVTDGDR